VPAIGPGIGGTVIVYFITGLCLLVGFVLLARWFTAVEPRKVITALRWLAAVIGLVVGGFLLWGGRQALAALALPMLLPILLRSGALWNRIKAAQGPRPGQTSSVETRFVRMTLDHDTGELSGIVREGAFRGRTLEEMSLEDLITLWRECRVEDAQSAAVLEGYLDRVHGGTWRAAAGGEAGAEGETAGARGAGAAGPPPGSGTMTREEAYEILGLQPGASTEEIRAAHRRLMQRLHPDHGGSNYLAAKINQAKDLLLRS